MESDLICVGICRRPQGIKGEVRITVLLDNVKDICKITELKPENKFNFYKVTRAYQLSDCYGIKLEGIDTVNDANLIKGKKLYAKKTEVDGLKTNELYIEDLMDKTAVFESGEVVGRIEDVENYGSADIVFIDSKTMKNLSFANVGGIIKSIDYENQKVILDETEFKKVCVFDD
ncbi:MAG: 16S rRNA processing protein RimM [Clostridia bacterium]|nr:16S rRNA processing protein RimM [Clostridia bacterium]